MNQHLTIATSSENIYGFFQPPLFHYDKKNSLNSTFFPSLNSWEKKENIFSVINFEFS